MKKRMPDIKVRVEVSDGAGISLWETATMNGQNVALNGEVCQLLRPVVNNLCFEVAKQLFNQLDDA